MCFPSGTDVICSSERALPSMTVEPRIVFTRLIFLSRTRSEHEDDRLRRCLCYAQPWVIRSLGLAIGDRRVGKLPPRPHHLSLMPLGAGISVPKRLSRKNGYPKNAAAHLPAMAVLEVDNFSRIGEPQRIFARQQRMDRNEIAVHVHLETVLFARHVGVGRQCDSMQLAARKTQQLFWKDKTDPLRLQLGKKFLARGIPAIAQPPKDASFWDGSQ